MQTPEHPDGRRVACSLVAEHPAHRHIHINEPADRADARLASRIGPSIAWIARTSEADPSYQGAYADQAMPDIRVVLRDRL